MKRTKRDFIEQKIRFTREQWEMIEKLTIIRKTTRAEVVRQIIEDYLKFLKTSL